MYSHTFNLNCFLFYNDDCSKETTLSGDDTHEVSKQTLIVPHCKSKNQIREEGLLEERRHLPGKIYLKLFLLNKCKGQ